MNEESPAATLTESEHLPKTRKIRRSPKASVKTKRAAVRSSANKEEISQYLTAIYRDDAGRVPDLKEIKIKSAPAAGRTFLYLLALGTLAAAVLWAALWRTNNSGAGLDAKIGLVLSGPAAFALGATTTYEIAYENNLAVPLSDVTINIYFPAGFILANSSRPSQNTGSNEWAIGALAPGERGSLALTGTSYGSIDAPESWRIFFNYRPKNFNSLLQKVAILNTVLSAPPFTLAVRGPTEAAAGRDTEYSFTVDRAAGAAVDAAELTPILPDNFYFSSSSPALNKNKRWLVSWTPAATSTPRVFKVRGKFADTGASTSTLKAALTLNLPRAKQTITLATAELPIVLIKTAVTLDLAVNGSLGALESHPGDMLNITVRLKNSSPATIKNAIIKLSLDAPSLKRQSILQWPEIADSHNGDIEGQQQSEDIRRGVITWNSRHFPALATIKPGEEADLDFSLPVKDSKALNWSELSGYQITTAGAVTFSAAGGLTQTIAANPLAIILNSDLTFESRDEASADADDKEQHLISWVLNNTYHPLKNIILSADAYGDISWQSASPTPAGTITFDAPTKKITWTIPEMPEDADVLAVPFTIILNAKNLSQNTLLSKVRIQADDAITGKQLNLMGDELRLNPPAN